MKFIEIREIEHYTAYSVVNMQNEWKDASSWIAQG